MAIPMKNMQSHASVPPTFQQQTLQTYPFRCYSGQSYPTAYTAAGCSTPISFRHDGLKVGNPTVEGATVEASVVENGKARKVIVYKYKRKTGYHKKNGHRQQYTAVKIEKINA